MSFDIKKIEFSKEHFSVVEVELDYCSNTLGEGICTASSVGDAKCFNTVESTQDLPNYTATPIFTGQMDLSVDLSQRYNRSSGSFITDGFVVGHKITVSGFPANKFNNGIKEISAVTALIITVTDTTFMSPEPSFNQEQEIVVRTTKTYRFCDPRSPLPTNLPSDGVDPDVIPSLANVNITAAKIDISGGLGQRSNASFSFKDFGHSDIGVDKYVTERTWLASDRGTFWTKLRARNPNYQFRAIRHLSGYLNADGSYDAANFQTRHYVIESLNASSGQANITAKDPLKLVMRKKAQVPAPSTGQLTANLAAGVLIATLKPLGVGNSEYDASGSLLIKDEVMTFTRAGDILTLVRGQRNTADVAHSIDDTVQQCYVKNDQVNIIVKDLLENFANIDTSLIPAAAWQSEIDTFLTGLLDGIIVKPMDVFKVLKELSDAMPHYLWWDERTQLINLTALKAPPLGADVIDMDENLIANSFSVRDKPEMRRSTIFVNFGQFDPTKRLDEPGNWEQSYVRVDTDSINKYNSNQVMTINSRWISNVNAAAARQLAALKGRRFSNISREVSFSLDSKDSDLWIGQSRDINHRDIVDFTGEPVDTTFQIISVRESDNYDYTGLEFTYGDSLPEDEGGGDPTVDLVILNTDQDNITLRTIFDTLFPAPDASTKAKFVVENGTVIGSVSVGTDSLDTGTWPAGATVTLQINAGAFVVGKGGDGEHESGTPAEEAGGDAINMQYDLEIINNGVIGGAGGGAKHNTLTDGGTGKVAGAAGAGSDIGLKGSNNTYTGSGSVTLNVSASDGSLEIGGTLGRLRWVTSGETFNLIGFSGGDLGDAGGGSGGAAGTAIKKNGNILTQTVAGDIRGAIT